MESDNDKENEVELNASVVKKQQSAKCLQVQNVDKCGAQTNTKRSACRYQTNAAQCIEKLSAKNQKIHTYSENVGQFFSMFGIDASHGPTVSDHNGEKSHVEGYWDARLAKLKNQRPNEQAYLALSKMIKASPNANRQLFRGLFIYFNGMTGEMSALHLGSLVRLYGGNTSVQLSFRKVTHIVCRNLSFAKTNRVIDKMGTRFNKIKIITADWILRCISEGHLVSEEPYLVIQPDSTGIPLISTFLAG